MSGLTFVLRPESFCIHRLPAGTRVSLARLDAASWYSVTRTEEELSVVVPEDIDPGDGEREPGWSCLQIEGPLPFGTVGILAGISNVLAQANVSIFTVSTYNTDHILVRRSDVERAVHALKVAGHRVTGG